MSPIPKRGKRNKKKGQLFFLKKSQKQKATKGMTWRWPALN
jgi:hypothetical protein